MATKDPSIPLLELVAPRNAERLDRDRNRRSTNRKISGIGNL